MPFEGLRYQPNPQKEPVFEGGNRVYRSAPEITWSSAAEAWSNANSQIDARITRKNAQIIVFSSHQQDVTVPFYRSLLQNNLVEAQTAIMVEQCHPDNEVLMLSKNELGKSSGVKSVYIVASLSNRYDWNKVRAVADHYKTDLGVPYVTLVASYIPSREDKNVDSTGQYRPNMVNLRTEIKANAGIIDRMMVIEPHSSATQYFAAEAGIPLVPISPWKILTDYLIKQGVQLPNSSERISLNPDNAVVIRPDKGRNIAATRISRHTHFPSVSFEKLRQSGTNVMVYDLKDTDKALIQGRIGLLYDDEASTVGTMRTIADVLMKNNALALAACLVHCKFTGEWYTNMAHPLLTTIIGTDSRTPIGNINMTMRNNIDIFSLTDLLRDLIAADLKGINFWNDPAYRSMILQQNGSHE